MVTKDLFKRLQNFIRGNLFDKSSWNKSELKISLVFNFKIKCDLKTEPKINEPNIKERR